MSVNEIKINDFDSKDRLDAITREKNSLVNVDTENELADIFTNTIPRIKYQKLRKFIKGWISILTRAEVNVSDITTNENFVFNTPVHI